MARRRRQPAPWNRRQRTPEGQLSFDLDSITPPDGGAGERPGGQLARKLDPPAPTPGRQATRIDPPGTGTQPGRGDTRTIAARQTTGIAARRVTTDVELRFDMFGVASSRVAQMGYNEEAQIVRVRFSDGTPWEYHEVPPQVWQEFKTADSPGRFIFDVLDQYPYGRGNF